MRVDVAERKENAEASGGVLGYAFKYEGHLGGRAEGHVEGHEKGMQRGRYV